MSYPTTFRYTKDHEWIDVAGDRGTIGITDYAQKQLGDVVFVDLPAVGSKIVQGQSFGTIESVKAVSELFAPVSGEVVDVNASLKSQTRSGQRRPSRKLADCGEAHQTRRSRRAARRLEVRRPREVLR